MRLRLPSLLLLALVLSAGGNARAGQTLTYRDGPYDLCKANWQAANYLQALISPRWKAVAFAHDCFGDAVGVGGLYFLDDQGRVIRCFAEEAEYGPVARVEAVAILAQGLMDCRIPGSAGRYFFAQEGRQAIFLQPKEEKLTGIWLQDTNTPFASLRVEIGRGGAWQTVRVPEASRTAGAKDGETICAAGGDGWRVTVHGFSGATDRAPYVEVAAERPVDVRVTLAEMGDRHAVWLGRTRFGAAGNPPPAESIHDGYLLAHRQALRSAAASDKRGWERPELWHTFDEMVMLAWSPQPARLDATAEGGLWPQARAEWRGQKRVRVWLAPFLEVDPADSRYVHESADRVAREGRFGFRPYLSVRTSNGFMGSLPGLASAAWLLERHRHPLAPRVKRAALEAFAAILASEGRGHHGEYGYNALSAAEYLRRIAPKEFDYARWARVWADRDLERCPPGWLAPPWPDTALRAIRGWESAWRLTGDARYREAAAKALAQFGLPREGPVDAFVWREKPHPLNGYNCTGGAMLLGEWGRRKDPRAHAAIERAAKGVVCDFGFTPLVTWTCDDLLPYYAGYSLPAVFGEARLPEPRRMVKLGEFVAYDRTGRVWSVPRPDFPPPP